VLNSVSEKRTQSVINLVFLW